MFLPSPFQISTFIPRVAAAISLPKTDERLFPPTTIGEAHVSGARSVMLQYSVEKIQSLTTTNEIRTTGSIMQTYVPWEIIGVEPSGESST